MRTPEQIAEETFAAWSDKIPPMAWDWRGFASTAAVRAQEDAAVELAAAHAREQLLRDALKSISTNTSHVACHTEAEYLGFIQAQRLAASTALSVPAAGNEADRYAARKLFKITEGRHHEETITMYELRRIANGLERPYPQAT